MRDQLRVPYFKTLWLDLPADHYRMTNTGPLSLYEWEPPLVAADSHALQGLYALQRPSDEQTGAYAKFSPH